MPTVVVDASAIGAIVFDEPRRNDVLTRLNGFDMAAPTLIKHELISIALKKARARPNERGKLALALRQYPAMRIHEQPVVGAAVLTLALDTGLSAYYASYLWLARHLRAELITLDGDLAAAAMASR